MTNKPNTGAITMTKSFARKTFTCLLSAAMLLTVCLVSPTASALNVSVEDADNGETGTPSLGTLSYVETVDIGSGASSQNLTYRISDLDLDGVGGNNDSVDITFEVSSDGTGGLYGVNFEKSISVDGSWLSGNDQLTISFSDIAVNTDKGPDSGIGTFLGISQYNINGWNNDEEAILTQFGSITAGVEDNPFDFDPVLNSVTLDFVSEGSEPGGATFRFNSFDFSFSAFAVPEPSTVMLIVLGGWVMVRARKRFQS